MSWLACVLKWFVPYAAASWFFCRASKLGEEREPVPRIKRTELTNREPIMCQVCGRPSWVVPGPVLMCRECAAEDAELNELIGL